LFNGKEIPVGLRDISMVFLSDGAEVISKPLSAYSGRMVVGRTTFDPLILINLSPRQWVHIELLGPLDVKIANRLRRVEFVGQRQRRGLFDRNTFRKTIATQPPFPDPWKRKPL
jgi:hypothetical protein